MARIWGPNGSGLALNAADMNAIEADLTSAVKPWAANTGYTTGQAVINPTNGRTITANSNFTSAATFAADAANWSDPAAGISAAFAVVFGG
jgi:hypothetical protein